MLSVCPMRPTKFRFDVAMAVSPFARMPICPPRQGPQVGVLTAPPASMKTLSRPSSIACRYTAWVAGMTMSLTSEATFLPRRIPAAWRRSSRRPLVQEPMLSLIHI